MSNLPEQIDALLALNAKGAVSHAVPGLAAELLEKAAKSLRSKPVAGVEVKPAEIEDIIEQLLDAQQDINLAANENMDQSLCDASALIDKTEAMLHRILSTLSLPAQEPEEVEFDPDALPTHSADNAADFILHELAKALNVDFRPAEGSETWEGDVLGTMWHALTDSGVIDEWDNSLRVSPKPAAAQEPVAWRCSSSKLDPNWWLFESYAEALGQFGGHGPIEPLYASPQPTVVTEEMVERIKKLPRSVMETANNNGDVFVSLKSVIAALKEA